MAKLTIDIDAPALRAAFFSRTPVGPNAMAERIGCSGSHKHKLPGVGAFYMPCSGGMTELLPTVAKHSPLTVGASVLGVVWLMRALLGGRQQAV